MPPLSGASGRGSPSARQAVHRAYGNERPQMRSHAGSVARVRAATAPPQWSADQAVTRTTPRLRCRSEPLDADARPDRYEERSNPHNDGNGQPVNQIPAAPHIGCPSGPAVPCERSARCARPLFSPSITRKTYQRSSQKDSAATGPSTRSPRRWCPWSRRTARRIG